MLAVSHFGFFIFRLTLLGWHWLIKLSRIQVYNSIIGYLYSASCAHHPKSNLFPTPHMGASLSFTNSSHFPFPFPFPRATTMLLSESVGFCLFVLFVHLLLTVLYPTYEFNHMVLDFLCLTYFICTIFSRPTPVVANGSISPFLTAEQCSSVRAATRAVSKDPLCPFVSLFH